MKRILLVAVVLVTLVAQLGVIGYFADQTSGCCEKASNVGSHVRPMIRTIRSAASIFGSA